MTARRYIATFTVLAFVAGFVNDDRDIVVFCLIAPAIFVGVFLLSFSLISQRRFSAMGKGRGVSSYTHTRSQCNHYANQHNPNNSAYRANQNNHANQCNPNNPNYAGRQSSSESRTNKK